MFKSILRTLPTLSGNFKLNCNVTKVKKIENNIYNGYVNTANIIPLKESLLSSGVKIALLNDSYEFDVAKYYYHYNDSFYNENFLFNKNDYQILNKYNKIYSRNKDYEFGCDRTSFKQTGYQFCFYAPIYCDNYDSLPEYFEITINFGNNLTKILRIKIKDNDNENYLRIYLKKYLNKITNNSVYMLPHSKQAAYDGINVKNGGFSIHTDDSISQIYNNQMTINNFDYLLCSGFKRNNMIMKQIIPLAFSFNINDILTTKEFAYRKNSEINIKGNYVKNNLHVDFFDFRYNYTDFKYKYLNYDTNNKIFKYNLSDNILNKDFPSLKESRFIKYKYSNKLSPTYCSWKLKYSDDENPYYTNLNYSFSDGQFNTYKYGEFPVISMNAIPKAFSLNNNLIMIIDNSSYNKFIQYIKTTFPDKKTTIDEQAKYNYTQYINSMNNYISTWYSLYNDFNAEISWKNVTDNNVYYNGVLYNLENITNKYKINKFAIFIKPNITIINKATNNKYILAKYLITEQKNNRNNTVKIFKPFYGNFYVPGIIYDVLHNKNIIDLNCNVQNNILMKKNNKYGYYREIVNYNDNNQYYLSNVLDIFKQDKYNHILDDNTFNNLKNNIIESYEIIDIYNKSNIVNNNTNIFKSIFNDDNNYNLYYSYNTKNKIKITKENINTIINLLATNNYNLYLYNMKKFISKRDIYGILENVYSKDPENVKNIINEELNKYKLYNYIPIDIYSNKYSIEDYFHFDNAHNEFIWVDNYNLKNIINLDNYIKLEKKDFFAKFLNETHIKEFIYEKNDAENYNIISNYFNYIFIRNRKYVKTIDNIKLNDKYITLNEFFNQIENKNNVENIADKTCKDKIITEIKFNESLSDLISGVNYNIEPIVAGYNKDKKLIIPNLQGTDGFSITCADDPEIIKYNKDTNKYNLVINKQLIGNYILIAHYIYNDIEITQKINININLFTFDTFLSNISHNGQLFTLKYKNKKYNLDLFCYTTFVKFNKVLYDYMFNSKNNKFRALYLYKYNNDHENIFEYITEYKNNNVNNEYIKEIYNESLCPLFTTIYNSIYYDEYIKSLFETNTIIKGDSEGSYYLYNKNTTGFITLQETDILFDEYDENEDKLQNILIESNIISDINYSKYNFTNTKLSDKLITLIINYINLEKSDMKKQKYENIINELKNIILNPKTENDYIIRELLVTYLIDNKKMPEIYSSTEKSSVSLIHDDNTDDYIDNINIKKNKDNESYIAYYLLSVNITNSNASINTNDNLSGIKYYVTINNVDFYNYMNNNFKILQPFILTNIFMLFKSYVNTIVDLTQLKLNIKYSPEVIDNGNTNKSYLYKGIFYNENDNTDKNVYDLYNINNKFTININRYLSNITPVLYKVSNNILYDTYQLYYKDIPNVINENNIYKLNQYLYKYSPIKVCNNYDMINYNTDLYNYYEIEYKFYNDNKFYNLEHEIIITYNKYFTYDELLEQEKSENILYDFKKYLNFSKNTQYNNDEVLFLYNKYDIQCLSEAKKINSLKNKKLYSLKLKLTLK